MIDTPTDQQHICHIGISAIDDSVRGLGETANSYGEKFGVGDTIVCAVDLESKTTASIGFSKNRKWLGCAKEFNGGMLAFFPHVLLKNVVVQMEFAIDDGLIPVNGYKTWVDGLTPLFMGIHCWDPLFRMNVIMMVGLPASGKTTWAEKLAKEHPEKRYVLLGKNLALEQMKIPTSITKTKYGERFDQLMDRATKIFNVLLSRASYLPRNFIIDQTNVYKSARKRILKLFADYIKIAVVVFPRPEELTLPSKKRFDEVGNEVYSEAVQEMFSKHTLPISKDMKWQTSILI